MSDGWDGWDEPGGRGSGGYRRPRRRGVRADDAYGYGSQDGYGGQDGYAADDYGTGGYADDGYGGDPYAAADGGYAASDGYGAYGAQDGYGQYAGYESGGGYDGQDDGYGWRESGPAQIPALEGGIDADSPRHNSFFRGFGGGGDAYLVRTARPRVRTVKRKKSSGAGLAALAIVLIIFAGIGTVGFHYYSLYKSRHAVFTGSGFGHATVVVNKGDSLSSIGLQLVRKHVIAAVDPWASYISSKPGSLQPGEYRLRLHMSPAAAFAALMDAKNRVQLLIPEGLRLTQLLSKLASESGIPVSQFQAASKETAQLGLPTWAKGKLEGFLWPATYPLLPGETALQILQAAVKEFNSQMAAIHMTTIAAQKQLTPLEVVTGASLLEAEVPPKYFKQVARVIDNRLNQNMVLGLDSTVAYALNKQTLKLSSADLAFNSPYNTLIHQGMPPGPIDSPGLEAINDFLNPAPRTFTFLFFVTVDKNGTTKFASTETQFEQLRAEAQKNGLA